MSAPPPRQYEIIFSFLLECSKEFSQRLGEIAAENEFEWNPHTSPFEVDVYFVFLLSFSLVQNKHSTQVWEEMCFFCKNALIEIYGSRIDNKKLEEMIIARIEGYGPIVARSLQNGDSPQLSLLKSLRQYVSASTKQNHVEANPSVLIGDVFQEFTWSAHYQRLDLFYAGSFLHGLRNICNRTNDLRTLSEKELLELERAGSEQATESAKNVLRQELGLINTNDECEDVVLDFEEENEVESENCINSEVANINQTDFDTTFAKATLNTANFSYHQREVAKLLWGLGDGVRYTNEEVARIFNTSAKTIEQIECEVVAKMELPALQSLVRILRKS